MCAIFFFWQKSWFILYCLNMSCGVICREHIIFLHLTFNVNLLMLRWNVSNDRRSSSYIYPTSVWTSEQGNLSTMSRTMLCRTSKPLKPGALSASANVSISWILSSIGGSSSIRIVSKTSTSTSIISQYSLLFASSVFRNPSFLLLRWKFAKYAPTN